MAMNFNYIYYPIKCIHIFIFYFGSYAICVFTFVCCTCCPSAITDPCVVTVSAVVLPYRVDVLDVKMPDIAVDGFTNLTKLASARSPTAQPRAAK